MAFIRRYNDQEGQGQNGLYSEATGAVAGQDEAAASADQQKKSTKAATPSSWYNIQDFLSANKSAIPKMQQGLKDKAQGLIDTDKAKAQSAINDISNIKRPEAMGWDENIAKSGTADQIQAGLSQDYNPQDYSGYNFSQNETLAGLKPNDFKSLLDFNSKTQKNKAGYTMGMGKMNELLLGSDPNAAKDLTDWTQNQYSEQVTNPLQQTITDAQTKDQAADTAVDSAKQGWWSGIKDFMGGNQKSIADKLTEQTNTFNSIKSQNAGKMLQKAIDKLGGVEKESSLTGKSYLDWDKFLKENSGKYAQFIGNDPTQETAAFSALGDQGINQYNMISNIMGNLDQTQNYGQLAGQEFSNPTWNLSADKLARDYQTNAYKAELQKAIAPGLEQYGNEMNEYSNVMKGYDDEIAQEESKIGANNKSLEKLKSDRAMFKMSKSYSPTSNSRLSDSEIEKYYAKDLAEYDKQIKDIEKSIAKHKDSISSKEEQKGEWESKYNKSKKNKSKYEKRQTAIQKFLEGK